jgi:site-specific DNA recombinase
MSTPSTKPLRFAAFVRVSTEEQERQGESLRTQQKQIQDNVALLKGSIAGWYGGQEHATEGWEKGEMVRLARDAAAGKFDAMMIAYLDRWDRGSDEAKEAVKVFKARGVRFFASVSEVDLFNPDDELRLDLFAAVGKWQAKNTKKKSLLNRIKRAERGIPTGGKLPFGRKYVRGKGEEVGRWEIIPAKQAMVEDVARRYLAGEQFRKLAGEYGVNQGNLAEVLRKHCGVRWVLDFEAPDLKIHETVVLTVPRLLPDKTIKEVCDRLDAKRTYLHGKPKHSYLLNGRVFCEVCGYSLFAGADPKGSGGFRRSYRHSNLCGARACPVRPRPRVPADVLEGEVIRQLFNLFGNPALIEQSVRAAVPDCDKAERERARLDRELDKVLKARQRILSLVVRDAVTEDDAARQLQGLKEREDELRRALDAQAEALADLPDEEALRCYVERCGDAIFVYDDNGDAHPGGNSLGTYLAMSWEDRRRLVEAVFDQPDVGGKPAGVYVSRDGEARPHRPKRWTFKIRGRLDFETVLQSVGNVNRQAEAWRSPFPSPAVSHAFRQRLAIAGCCC